MLRDGKYAAWFRTARGQGTGIVHLADGRISGCDSFFVYGGSYCVEANTFTAKLTVRRCAEGPQNVFGLDEIEVSLTGECNGAVATCSGTAERAPDLPFEATLIYSQEETAPPPARCAVVKLRAERLPNNPDSRWRPHHP